jgi:hypothetical protein
MFGSLLRKIYQVEERNHQASLSQKAKEYLKFESIDSNKKTSLCLEGKKR